jgi:hypothetical protein
MTANTRCHEWDPVALAGGIRGRRISHGSTEKKNVEVESQIPESYASPARCRIGRLQ